MTFTVTRCKDMPQKWGGHGSSKPSDESLEQGRNPYLFANPGDPMAATPCTTYYSVRTFMKTGYQDTSFFDEEFAKKFAAMFEAPYDAIVRSSTCGPIEDGFTPYSDSPIINYEIDCGCHVTVWDGRKSIDRCHTPDCHDPELCVEHPNFFTQAYVEIHARKFYL